MLTHALLMPLKEIINICTNLLHNAVDVIEDRVSLSL